MEGDQSLSFVRISRYLQNILLINSFIIHPFIWMVTAWVHKQKLGSWGRLLLKVMGSIYRNSCQVCFSLRIHVTMCHDYFSIILGGLKASTLHIKYTNQSGCWPLSRKFHCMEVIFVWSHLQNMYQVYIIYYILRQHCMRSCYSTCTFLLFFWLPTRIHTSPV